MNDLLQRRRAGSVYGIDLLRDPALNKGTACTEAERDRHGLRGLLPPKVNTLDEQLQRVRKGLSRQPDDLAKYVYLAALQDRNETLYYRLLIEDAEDLMPIVYTPTVGAACEQFGHIYQRPHGIFLSIHDKGHIADVLRNWPWRDVAVIVVTDGERILGLGDLGANGMGIPIGKLALYTALAGVPPTRTLPVTLDVGTENPRLLDDPLYIGLSHKRVRGEAYDAFIEEFVAAANEVFPGVLLQFEDFANTNAFRILHRYRDRVSCFNDDIQGTASVVLAGLFSAMRLTGKRLEDQTVLCLGAGEAATGICDLIGHREKCWLVDSKGLVVASRSDLSDHKKPYAHRGEQLSLLEAVRKLRPSILIGASGQPQTFTREIVEEMAKINQRPIIFALSNPTSKSECTFEQAYDWTGGRVIFASGSPFPPYKGQVPGQGNNAYIFPGVGLGALTCGATRITDEMFSTAAATLAKQVTDDDFAVGRIYPSVRRIREVSLNIAVAVCEVAYARGLAHKPEPKDLMRAVKEQTYLADYPEL